MPFQVIPVWDRQCWSFDAEYISGENVGRLTVQRFDRYLEVHELIVAPEVRQLNIGNALLSALCRFSDVASVELRVQVRQIKTREGGEVPPIAELIRFFRAHGFKSYTDDPVVMKRTPAPRRR